MKIPTLRLARPATLLTLILGCSRGNLPEHELFAEPEPVRAIAAPLSSSANVIWFDGYSELRGYSGGTGTGAKNVAVQRGVNATASHPANGNAIGAGVFVWTMDIKTADDNATVIVPTGSRTGAWKRTFDNTFNVQWFGAICDGVTYDDTALELALAAANVSGGTILIPAQHTCALKVAHNLGNVNGTGLPAVGVTIRGAGRGSVLRMDAPLASCTATGGGAPFSTSVSGSAVASNVTFEDLTLQAGVQFGFKGCLLNITGVGPDANWTTVRGVTFAGAPTPQPGHCPQDNCAYTNSPQAAIFLSNASFTEIDRCAFGYFVNAIATDSGNHYVNNLVIQNSSFTSQSCGTGTAWTCEDPNAQIYISANAQGGVAGIHFTGNTFEQGPNAIQIRNQASPYAAVIGGDISGNWFRAENTFAPPSLATWIQVDSAQGLSVSGNYFNAGSGSIWMNSYAATIHGNAFEQTYGTAITIQSGSVTIQGNNFAQCISGLPGGCQAGVNAGPDILVNASGGGHVGPNNLSSSTVPVIKLNSGSNGIIEAAAAQVTDSSGGGWTQLWGGSQLVVPGQLSTLNALSLTQIAPPAAPPSGSFLLFVDATDGKLKAKGFGGTVTTLASP
jgi:hypothetical protein